MKILIALNASEAARLEEMARREHRSKTAQAKKLILDGLDRETQEVKNEQ